MGFTSMFMDAEYKGLATAPWVENTKQYHTLEDNSIVWYYDQDSLAYLKYFINIITKAIKFVH